MKLTADRLYATVTDLTATASEATGLPVVAGNDVQALTSWSSTASSSRARTACHRASRTSSSTPMDRGAATATAAAPPAT